MKKVFEITFRTKVRRPTQSKFLRLWRAITCSGSVVYIDAPGICPHPDTLLSLLYGDPLWRVFLEIHTEPRSGSSDCYITTRRLPRKAGNGFVSSVIQVTPKGATVSAKILTRLEYNEVRLSIYAENLETLPHKAL